MQARPAALPQCFRYFALFLLATLLFPALNKAQEVSGTNPDQTVHLGVSKTDHAAATSTSGSFKHILTPKSRNGIRTAHSRHLLLVARPTVDNSSLVAPETTAQALPQPGYYPADVSDYQQGPVVTEATNHPVYVNAVPGALGNPGTLLRDLGKSEMVHVIDQYVGRTDDNRYRPGLGLLVTYPISGPLYDADILAILHTAASAFRKTGYHAVYHIFTAPGQDVCYEDPDTGLNCYSPDNTSVFTFCAYHDSVDFNDIGHVLYTVLPFQAVAQCQTGPPSPNGLVVDSTMDSLSHEFFETITDPDANAWWNQNSADLNGDEIADECDLSSTTYPVAILNGRKYELEGEYSNKYHGCSFVP